MEALRRREFLAISLAAAASLRAAEPKDKFPTRPRERLAVSTYPFRSLIAAPHTEDGEAAKPGMRLEQFAQTVVSKLNVSGIEPWSPHFQSTEPDYIHGLNQAFRNAGLHVVNIPVDSRVHPCGTPADRQNALAVYHKWVDAAVILGSPGIRVHLPRGEEGNEISCAVSSLTMLAEYGASKNIVISLENDNPKNEQPERIVRVIQAVNSPFLRALPDFCNSMAIHDDQNYNLQAMKMLFPLAYSISHVKDMETGGGKVYRVDVDPIFAVAKNAGYRGYFSMEFEGKGDPYEGTTKLLEASMRALG